MVLYSKNSSAARISVPKPSCATNVAAGVLPVKLSHMVLTIL